MALIYGNRTRKRRNETWYFGEFAVCLPNSQRTCRGIFDHGGAAVNLHGHERLSKDSLGQDTEIDDLDFWYNPTYDNYFRLLNALEKLGQDVSGFREEQTPDPKRSFFRLERPHFTLDFLPVMPGLPRFREAFTSKETTKIGDVEIPVIRHIQSLLLSSSRQ
jgi:hypothetical protein